MVAVEKTALQGNAMLKYYVKEALEPTLLFGPICVLIGLAAAHASGVQLSIFTALLLVIGSIFAYVSVNVIDDYFDFRSGIDSETVKTRFSGGSALIVKRRITPKGALSLGIGAFIIAASIGVYLALVHPIAGPFIVLGALSILLYAKFFSRVPFVSEPLTAINNACIAIASFLVAGGTVAALPHVVFAAVPAGLIIGAILIANELPDMRVDRKYGRKSGVAILNSRKKVAYYYLGFQIVAYAFVVVGVLFGMLPKAGILILITVPVMAEIFCGIAAYSNPKSYEKYMGLNVAYSMTFIVLLFLIYAL